MSTTIRAEVSTKSPYWIPRHRYYELKHFCMQYGDWKAEYDELERGGTPSHLYSCDAGRAYSNPTEKKAIRLYELETQIDLIESCCKEAGESIWEFLLQGVTESYSYNYLRYRANMPCGKDYYYEAYRKFFYILSKRRK